MLLFLLPNFPTGYTLIAALFIYYKTISTMLPHYLLSNFVLNYAPLVVETNTLSLLINLHSPSPN